MDGMYSTALALRAIIAIFLHRTIGRFLILAAVVALVIALLSAYQAANGAPLLWAIFAFVSALLILFLLCIAATYFAVFKLLPRKLNYEERRRINRFAKTLFERLQFARAPIPLMAWHLLVQAIINQKESEQKQHVQHTIEQSHSLSHDFKMIRGYFEVK